MNEPVEIWRGGVNTWECDEMGHLNVRFYVSRAMEGLVGVAGALGLPGAFRANAGATLLVKDHHIRFLREARPRAALHMVAGVLEIGEADAVVKGQTASSSYKPAKLSNGARVMVPPHIAPGTRVVILTEDGSYVERAKD